MITNLLYKPSRYKPMIAVDRLRVTTTGIAGAAPSSPLRHLLLLPLSTLNHFKLTPGDLRENVIFDDDALGNDFHSFASGTVLQIEAVKLRLTFHCEPCARLKNLVNTKSILHRRGYLAAVIAGGEVTTGQRFVVKDVEFEEIPYETKDRIAWYMSKHEGSIGVTSLVHEVGLSLSYCRAIPTILKSRPDLLSRVTFRGKRLREPVQSKREETLSLWDQSAKIVSGSRADPDEGIADSLELISGGFVVYLKHGSSFTVPLQSVPALLTAGEHMSQQWEIVQGGTVIRWPALNLEVSVAKLLGVGI